MGGERRERRALLVGARMTSWANRRGGWDKRGTDLFAAPTGVQGHKMGRLGVEGLGMGVLINTHILCTYMEHTRLSYEAMIIFR